MNSNSVAKEIERQTGLKRSTKEKKYAQECGRGNICYAYRFAGYRYHGDFHVGKRYNYLFEIVFDSPEGKNKKNEVIQVLNDLDLEIDFQGGDYINFKIPEDDNKWYGQDGMYRKGKWRLSKMGWKDGEYRLYNSDDENFSHTITAYSPSSAKYSADYFIENYGKENVMSSKSNINKTIRLIKSSQAYVHQDNMETIRERLENTITQSSVDTMYDGEDCFITVTQRNETTGNESTWSFCVDFGTNKVRMLEPTEDEESFSSDNEVFRIIKNFLNGGSSREKRMNRPDYDSGEPIKITGFGNKIGSSRKPIKSGYVIKVTETDDDYTYSPTYVNGNSWQSKEPQIFETEEDAQEQAEDFRKYLNRHLRSLGGRWQYKLEIVKSSRKQIESSIDKQYHYYSALDSSGKEWLESIVKEFGGYLKSHIEDLGTLSATYRTWGKSRASANLICDLYEDGYHFATLDYKTTYYDNYPHSLEIDFLGGGNKYYKDLSSIDVSQIPWQMYSLYDSYLYEMRRNHNNYVHTKNGGKVQNGIPVYPIESRKSVKSSTVYSDSFDEMVQKNFTYKGNKYTWNDSDCLYYNDNGDEDDFFMEIPEGAITSAKKPIKSAHDRETLKKVIRAYLDKMGYKDVEGGVDAAADYILQNEEYYSDYDFHSKVKQWFKETKENYPETLIKASKTIKSDYTPDYSSRIFKGARFKNPTTGAICEIVRVEPENNYVLYKFNDKLPEDTTIDGIIALLKHNNYYPIASNTPGKVIREEEDDAGYIVQLVELDDGRYKVCDNNNTEDICDTYDKAVKMFYTYLG